MRMTNVSNCDPEKFVSCRVGLELSNYREDLATVLSDNYIYGQRRADNGSFDPSFQDNKLSGNFILVPMLPPRLGYFDSHFIDDVSSCQFLPDLALPRHRWENEVAISIGQLPPCADNRRMAQRYDTLIKHALYLPSPIIVIDMPPTRQAQIALAEVINDNLSRNHSQRLLLMKVRLTSTTGPSRNTPEQYEKVPMLEDSMHAHIAGSDDIMSIDAYDGSSSESGIEQSSSQNSRESNKEISFGGWEGWNGFRSHLVPDHRIGVSLIIDNDMEYEDIEDSDRWRGEPVRMIIMSSDRFTSTKGFQNSMRPVGGIKEFMKMIAVSNSMKTSFVVQSKSDCDAQPHLECLSGLCDYLDLEFLDYYRAWDDLLLDPLQPLSSNLDSNTYSVFEQDKAKYSKYQEAMLMALGCLLTRPDSSDRTSFTLMVLGAGRGPLVDAFISAIHKLNPIGSNFKIYALDKNSSSIFSMRYKKVMEWDDYLPKIKVEIIMEDMRTWTPDEKADIIATELLGSFSDNELSPECINGTWRLATPQTISIPQSYSSFLAPICSFKMRQELHKASLVGCNNLFDRIQVSRLRNYYLISNPRKLFTYEHGRLDLPTPKRANERNMNLEFYTEVETTCHGFAGFFEANLFGDVTISTNPSTRTQNMESWFPVYIPIEEPFLMRASSSVEVAFSRKEDDLRVWYEWALVNPKPSRIHNKDGIAASMSKIIQ